MSRTPKRYLLPLALLVGVQAGLTSTVSAKSIALYGNWRAGFNGTDRENSVDGFTDLRQRYDIRWSPLVTSKIDLNADVGYTNNWIKNQGTRQILNPSLNLGVNNDLFAFGFDTYMVLNFLDYGPDRSTTAWNADLASTWERYLWPRLQVSAGQRQEDVDYSDINRTNGDRLYSYGEGSVFWDWYRFNLYYNYYQARTDDAGIGSVQDETRHIAQLRYNDTFWDNRLQVNFSQQYYQYASEYTFDNGTTPLISVPISNAQAGNDFTPLAGALPGNGALIDGNRDASAFVIQVQQPANLAVQTNFRPIDRLYVYTTKDNNLLLADTSQVTWALYTSSDGITWQQVSANVPSTFNRDEFRFEVRTGTVQALFVKLVATGWIPSLDINVSEVEAYALVQGGAGDSTDTSTQHKTDLYLGITPTRTTNFNYTFSYDQTEYTGATDQETEQFVHTARFDWYFSRYLNPSIGFSDIIQNQTFSVDTESRIYNLSLRSTPIPTVNTTLSVLRGENYEDSVLTTTNHNINFNTLATLYPDLTSEFDIGYTLYQSELSAEENNSLYLRLVLRSRLRETLNVDWITEYSTYDSQVEIIPPSHLPHGGTFIDSTGGTSGLTSLNVSWRPSDLLSCQLYGVTSFGSGENDVQSLVFSSDYLALRTSKTNLIFSYRLNTSKQDTINNFGFVWGWDLSNYFILRTTGNYVLSSKENTWNVTTQLTAKF